MAANTTDGRLSRGGSQWGRLVLAAFGALLIVVALLWVSDPRTVVHHLDAVTRSEAVLLLGVALLPLIVWGCALSALLCGVGVPVGIPRSVALFTASVFLNNVTPFGQVGGDPPSAVLIAHVTGTRVEQGLAGITSLNLINRLASLLVGLVGIAVLARSLGPVGPWVDAAIGILGSGIALAVVVWLYARRSLLAERITPPLAMVAIRIGRLLPGLSAPTGEEVSARVRGFVTAVERLAADPRRLGVVLGLGILGQLLVAEILWLALSALGMSVSPAIVLLVVPTAKLSGLVPTPGGAGGVIALVAGLLTATTGFSLGATTSGAILYRAVAFWFPTVLGGIVALGLTVVQESD